MVFNPLLIIEHNYNIPRTIEALEHFLKDKFPDRVHLVPHYRGRASHIFPVYEHSIYFERYFSQTADLYYDKRFTHYIVIADDLFLNPSINYQNINDYLRLDNSSSFLPTPWGMLHELSFKWANTMSALNAFYSNDLYFHHAPQWKEVFPPLEEAWQIFNKYGFKQGKLKFNWEKPNAAFPTRIKSLLYYIKLILRRRLSLPYPLIASYSEFFVVDSQAFLRFSELCETAGKMRLWVEVAIPTLLLLCSQNVIFEKDRNLHGKTYWTPNEVNNLIKRNEGHVKNLIQEFDNNTLYLHPIKLSTWNYQ